MSNSTLPPILNGMEVYWPMTMEVNRLTSASDVSGIMAVKDDYKIVRNWNGDPCSAANFSWNGVSCSTNEPPQITSLGGFGIVYHGYLDNRTEVAVKTCTLESSQANKQFLAEVRSLSLVHHKNLVTLVGYCKDGVNLAVVYEYLLRGSLFDHLRGKNSSFALNWKMRLNIVLDAAQALDYLHTGCGMVHRDVKSSNILLGQNFEAKVSDLGLARMFSADANSIITLSGTPGYMDPEYQLTFTLNEKSDVYSFGVILMEIVTGEPPILTARENIHIVKFIKQKLAAGSIDDVVDSRFEGEYDMNSVWKVVELAIICTRDESANRPTMADVVMHLKDCVQIEEYRQRGKLQPSEKSYMNMSSISTSHSMSVSFAPISR
ncbi:Leucine-rich repeat protein kinase family protein [Rhynchospora pubera]|uniref:Leucine-rich repeat protein kinase family protein n=1 Tax=Rhynchospora pubera TaxID=906938 RepID=A0AAV8FBB8_9POAL|nr:Leucine-rich repeat protein kinase family protein [Rhynchospora pubera]